MPYIEGANPITNIEDIIDSRDVIARIERLEGDEDLDEAEREELTTLTELAEAAGGASDWPHGEMLIRDSYFEEHAEELASDTSGLPGYADITSTWPFRHIDWKAAADELRQDYTEVEFDGITYWIRW